MDMWFEFRHDGIHAEDEYSCHSVSGSSQILLMAQLPVEGG